MSDSQRHILIYGTDGTFPSCRKGFSGTRNGLFEVTGGCVPACMKGVLESRNGLFRATETAGARSERIHIRFLYTINAFALPVFRFYYVKIFYCLNCISMHSGILRAFSIPFFPPQCRPPSRDAKSCVSQAGIALFIMYIITPEICTTSL